jgi:hypothetical protein
LPAEILLLAAAPLALFFMGRKLFRRTPEEEETPRVLLRIRVTKNTETGPIAAEQMLSALHGIFNEEAGAKQPHLSLEIAALGKEIFFFVETPEEFRELVEQQFYAQYPRIEINEVEDYAAADLQGKGIAAGELILSREEIFPIRRAASFADEVVGEQRDPLAAITSTLSRIDSPEDATWLQILIRPVNDDWQKRAEEYAAKVNAGEDPDAPPPGSPWPGIFVRILFFPIWFPFWLLKFLFVSGGEEAPAEEKEERPRVSEESTAQLTEIREKARKLGWKTRIRIVAIAAEGEAVAKRKVAGVAGAFKQFTQTNLNGFRLETPSRPAGLFGRGKKSIPAEEVAESFRRREFPEGSGFVLNVEELATIYHQPNQLVRTPGISWVTSKKEEAPANLPLDGEDGLCLLGVTNFRNLKKKFGIRLNDRKRHIYILGKTGMGKTTLLGNMIYTDILEGKGLAYIDPHGDMADEMLEMIPPWRRNDVIVFDPSDADFPIGFNLLDCPNENQKPLVVSAVVASFKKQFGESWGPRMEWVLMNTIGALLDAGGQTILGILRMYTDEHYRDKIVEKIKDPVCRSYWREEFPNYNPRELPTIVGPIQNKVGQFLSSPLMRNMLGQPRGKFSIRQAMDEGKIIICNLSRGKLGETNMGLLGSLLVSKFQLEAMGRADIPAAQRKDFFLYVDEFQNFATDAFAVILSESRKYALSLCVANQYIAQMPDEVRESIFGNVGSLITFQVGADDAELMAKQFGEILLPADFAELGVGEVYLKMLVDMMPSPVFSAKTIWEPDARKLWPEGIAAVRKVSRERYAAPREDVVERIERWSASSSESQVEHFAKTSINRRKKGKDPLPVPPELREAVAKRIAEIHRARDEKKAGRAEEVDKAVES